MLANDAADLEVLSVHAERGMQARALVFDI